MGFPTEACCGGEEATAEAAGTKFVHTKLETSLPLHVEGAFVRSDHDPDWLFMWPG